MFISFLLVSATKQNTPEISICSKNEGAWACSKNRKEREIPMKWSENQ
jgi:hypothetical protein